MNPQETNELKALIRSLRDELRSLRSAHRARHEHGHVPLRYASTSWNTVRRIAMRHAGGNPRATPDVIKAYLGESPTMLELRNRINTFYGKIQALTGRFPTKSRTAEIVTLIGANGAGKIYHPHVHMRRHASRAAARFSSTGSPSSSSLLGRSSSGASPRFPKAASFSPNSR